MSNYRVSPSRPAPSSSRDRAKAIAAVALVHVGMGALLLTQPTGRDLPADDPPIMLIDIAPPPPPPPIEARAGRMREAEGAAGKKADPSPVVAPPPRIPLATPLPAAPVAGTGTASTSGAAEAGTGPGAGGSGSGRGGGGSGGGIGAPPRLVSGGLTRRDYGSIRGLMGAGSSGQTRLAIMVGANGRVERCSIANSSGDPHIDATLCRIVQPRMRWAAARDTAGNPIRVGVYYIATWQRF